MEGKLKDVRFRLAAQRREVEQTNQTRETRIAEITLLQQQLQVHTYNIYIHLIQFTLLRVERLKTVLIRWYGKMVFIFGHAKPLYTMIK